MIAVYARVSTEEQAKHGFSVAAQIRECRALAGGGNCLIFADEGVSGETLKRPALEELRAKIREGQVAKVICLDPDRLSRKLLHQLLLTEEWENYAVKLCFVNGEYKKTPEGNLFYALRGAISEFEKAKITERMCRGRREKARQGRVLRDFQIYGYDFEPRGEQLVINHREARIVTQIFLWFLAPPPGMRGISGIARALTDSGVPTKRGALQWHRQVVRQILGNSTYRGQFYQNKWDASGPKVKLRPEQEWILIPCPRIIADHTFQQAQLLLGAARRRHAGRASEFLLSGLLSCGRCGQFLKGKTQGAQQVYGESFGSGCGLSIPKAPAERAVWAWFEHIVGDALELGNSALELETKRTLLRMLVKEITIGPGQGATIITF